MARRPFWWWRLPIAAALVVMVFNSPPPHIVESGDLERALFALAAVLMIVATVWCTVGTLVASTIATCGAFVGRAVVVIVGKPPAPDDQVYRGVAVWLLFCFLVLLLTAALDRSHPTHTR